MPAVGLVLVASLGAAAADAGTVQPIAKPAAQLYVEKCSVCHGQDGRGDTRMGRRFHAPDFTAEKFQGEAQDPDLKRAIMGGVVVDGMRRMPAWQDKLTATQIDGLVSYVRSFRGAKPPPAR